MLSISYFVSWLENITSSMFELAQYYQDPHTWVGSIVSVSVCFSWLNCISFSVFEFAQLLQNWYIWVGANIPKAVYFPWLSYNNMPYSRKITNSLYSSCGSLQIPSKWTVILLPIDACMRSVYLPLIALQIHILARARHLSQYMLVGPRDLRSRQVSLKVEFDTFISLFVRILVKVQYFRYA